MFLHSSAVLLPTLKLDEPKISREMTHVATETSAVSVALTLPSPSIAALEEVFRQVTRAVSASLFEHNRLFHQMLVEGVNVEYRRVDGTPGGAQVKLVDFTEPAHNDWVAVNQFASIEARHNRCPDVVVFLNGLPLAVIELKNPADENATIKAAFNQCQTYKQDIPSLFPYNELLVISDGLEALVGTPTSEWERFMPRRTIDGTEIAPKGSAELEVLLKGIFDQRRFLDLLQHFMASRSARTSLAHPSSGSRCYRQRGTHSHAAGWQETPPAGRDGTLEGVCAGGAARAHARDSR